MLDFVWIANKELNSKEKIKTKLMVYYVDFSIINKQIN